jgi:hypothetical protein
VPGKVVALETRGQIVASICTTIMGGATVAEACREQGVSRDTLHRWVAEDPQLGEAYSRARAEQAHSMADQALEIADEPAETSEEVQRNRLRVDTRKWLASKIAPRVYGERIAQDVTIVVDRAEELKAARIRASVTD